MQSGSRTWRAIASRSSSGTRLVHRPVPLALARQVRMRAFRDQVRLHRRPDRGQVASGVHARQRAGVDPVDLHLERIGDHHPSRREVTAPGTRPWRCRLPRSPPRPSSEGGDSPCARPTAPLWLEPCAACLSSIAFATRHCVAPCHIGNVMLRESRPSEERLHSNKWH